MRKLPPLTELRAFEATARHLSFKAAAAELGVTPTAISHQIRLLEHECGQALFRRHPRPVVLTPAGERLFPAVRDAFVAIAAALSDVRSTSASGRLRITATNAFAARWLVPRLPSWRKSNPRVKLEINGTDAVLDLAASEADVAIRYARRPPKDGLWVELLRDTFFVVASPRLIGRKPGHLRPAQLLEFPLIEAEWPAADRLAPRWKRWECVARRRYKSVPDLTHMAVLIFREELHAIDAVVAGQGIGICSDVLVATELAEGSLVKVSKVTLPGYGFYGIRRSGHPKETAIKSFLAWAGGAA